MGGFKVVKSLLPLLADTFLRSLCGKDLVKLIGFEKAGLYVSVSKDSSSNRFEMSNVNDSSSHSFVPRDQ